MPPREPFKRFSVVFNNTDYLHAYLIMPRLHTRFLEVKDVPALLELEHAKWESNQAACATTLQQRIEAYPQLCIGTFCIRTGKALASLFMRPINPAIFIAPTRWDITASMADDCVSQDNRHSLFGISLSSNDAAAAKDIFRFFYPRALKAGWQDIYLGSPIPGFQRARQKNPELAAWEYVHKRKKSCSREPLDPQLAYYFKKGFKRIVSIQANYFPHGESMDYGVILHGVIPLSGPKQFWKRIPFSVLKPMSGLLFGLI